MYRQTRAHDTQADGNDDDWSCDACNINDMVTMVTIVSINYKHDKIYMEVLYCKFS